MLKEIHEQPDALRETIGERLEGGEVVLDTGLTDDQLRAIDRVSITACGTACHAGMVGRLLIEQWAKLPVDIEYASEFRYRFPVVDERTLAIAVSQSGETADTIAAQRVAREGGALTLAICNQMGSQLTREADGTLYTRSGREICVAATKTFTSQVMAFTLFALHLAELRETLEPERIAELRAGIDELPELAAAYLAEDSPVWAQTERIADEVWEKEFFLYIGRHLGMPVCLEGALKLKEISYIPTDSYAAGEMKHGPIALLSEDTPVVAVMNDSHVYEKVASNVQEVRARGARVIAVITEGNEDALAPRRLDAADPAHRARAGADPGVDPAADPGLPHRAPARPADRSAAQPGQDRHRRVAGPACFGREGFRGTAAPHGGAAVPGALRGRRLAARRAARARAEGRRLPRARSRRRGAAHALPGARPRRGAAGRRAPRGRPLLAALGAARRHRGGAAAARDAARAR